MSENLSKLFTTQYSTILTLKLQQKTSKLRGRAMEGQHVGKQASPVQYAGTVKMMPPQGRFSPIGRQDMDFVRRWVFPVDRDCNQLIDTFDKLKTTVNDVQSQEIAAVAAAVNREYDDRLIAAAFGTTQLGTDGAAFTAETWASISSSWQVASTFGSAAASGLTVAKMIEAKRIMRKAQVDMEAETLTWVTNSQGEADLLNQVQVVSTDFSDRPVLTDGKVTRLLGWDIVYSERLPSASNVRSNIPFAKSGLYLGIWEDRRDDVDQRKDLSAQPWQIYTMMSCGAARLEPGRLLEVLCADTSAAADVTP